jgi:hypothetical protein
MRIPNGKEKSESVDQSRVQSIGSQAGGLRHITEKSAVTSEGLCALSIIRRG